MPQPKDVLLIVDGDGPPPRHPDMMRIPELMRHSSHANEYTNSPSMTFFFKGAATDENNPLTMDFVGELLKESLKFKRAVMAAAIAIYGDDVITADEVANVMDFSFEYRALGECSEEEKTEWLVKQVLENRKATLAKATG